MSRAESKRWIGFGVKSGGQLLIGGVESVTAFMVNLESGETFDLEIISSRWGLGLGGSGGAVAVLGFGFIEPYNLHGKPENDWGVNIAFTEKLISKSVIQSLVFSKRFIEIYRANRALLAYRHVKSAFKDMAFFEQIRNTLVTVYAGFEASKHEGIVVIELPVASVGLEVSGYVTRGTMYVSNSSDAEMERLMNL
ncbi:MAG TPA: hypothetical protein VKC66_24010 [Xanthobacteraceae bacterium]|nr:hypothetical protein [Xanthobacteraceae bacterium]